VNCATPADWWTVLTIVALAFMLAPLLYNT